MDYRGRAVVVDRGFYWFGIPGCFSLFPALELGVGLWWFVISFLFYPFASLRERAGELP